MTKLGLFSLCLSGCMAALPVMAATPDMATGISVSAPDKPAQAPIIKIGSHFCPAAPNNGISDKAKKTLALVSTTCIMEASGLITHGEAQSVYEQALGNIQTALSEIPMDDTAPALASK